MNPPQVTEFEQKTNLTMLQHQLHGRMKCFAGKNKVYLRSVLRDNGQKTRPRIALKCSLRAEFNMPRHVYFEYIRDVCCDDPSQCPAVQRFLEENPEAARALGGAAQAASGANGTHGAGHPAAATGSRPPDKPVLE